MNLLLTLALLTPALSFQDEHRDVRVLDLEGTPHERGLAHGRALREGIREVITDFERDLESDHGVAASVFIERFLADTNFVPAIEQWTPGLIDEVRGIAEGSGLSFERVFTFQLADEIWSMGKWSVREKCTAIAVDPRGDQPAIVAQNMDIPGFYQKYPTLLRIHYADRSDALVLTVPGLIGVNGMNSDSVAIACNTLLQLRPNPEGVPTRSAIRPASARSSAPRVRRCDSCPSRAPISLITRIVRW